MTFIGLKTETVSDKPIEKPVNQPESLPEHLEEQPAAEKPSTKGGGKK